MIIIGWYCETPVFWRDKIDLIIWDSATSPIGVLLKINLHCQHIITYIIQIHHRKETSRYIKCSFIQCHHFHCCSYWKPKRKDRKTCSHLKSFVHIWLHISQKSGLDTGSQWKTKWNGYQNYYDKVLPDLIIARTALQRKGWNIEASHGCLVHLWRWAEKHWDRLSTHQWKDFDEISFQCWGDVGN